MKKFTTSLKVLLTAALLIFIMPLQHIAAEENNITQVNYLALGDSLATGITPNNKVGKGYTDFIAQKIMAIGGLNSFNKGFAYPGYTTGDVRSAIENNVENEVVGIGFEDGATQTIHEAITDADIITLSIGANDALDVVDVDTDTGEVNVELSALMTELEQMNSNLSTILGEIESLNPNAHVYVMGYYNPFPQLPNNVQPQVKQLLNQLNNAIKEALQGTNAHYVETRDTIAKDFSSYLPNPENIHLSEQGYQKVASLFGQQITNLQWILHPSFNDIDENWAQLYAEKAFEANLINGYAEEKFKPYDELTRVQAASVLTRMLDLETEEQSPFTDINKIHNKTKAEINAAYEAGLINGYPDGSFKPYKKVTRAHLAMMIKRAFESLEDQDIVTDINHPFSDVGNNYSIETIEAINFVNQMDIASGSNGKYMPENSTLRQQAAKMFVNTLNNINKTVTY